MRNYASRICQIYISRILEINLDVCLELDNCIGNACYRDEENMCWSIKYMDIQAGPM